MPWLLVNSAANFLTFLGSYLCFISPIVACMIVDYWVVRHGNLHVLSLYRANSSSPYWYNHGFNPRAFAAWISGIVLVIPGIAGAIKPGSISQVSTSLNPLSLCSSWSWLQPWTRCWNFSGDCKMLCIFVMRIASNTSFVCFYPLNTCHNLILDTDRCEYLQLWLCPLLCNWSNGILPRLQSVPSRNLPRRRART